MKVKISELKAKLSAYLDAVRRGQTITVLDRKTPVAQLSPVADRGRGLRVAAASRPPADIRDVKGVRPRRPVDVVEILREARGER